MSHFLKICSKILTIFRANTKKDGAKFHTHSAGTRTRLKSLFLVHSRVKAVQWNSTYPDVGYPDRLGLLGKYIETSTKLICLEITGYRIKYCTVF